MDLGFCQIIGALLVGTLAVIWDLKTRKIPNWLTFPSMLLGFILQWFFDSKEWFFPLLGILAGLLLFGIPFALGGIGAGDLKLLMALGSFMGYQDVFWISLLGGISGGAISLGKMIYSTGLSNIQKSVCLFFAAFWNPSARKILHSPPSESRLYIPYGLAIYVGLVLTLIWRS